MSGFGTEQAMQETQMSALSEERKLVRGSFSSISAHLLNYACSTIDSAIDFRKVINFRGERGIF